MQTELAINATDNLKDENVLNESLNDSLVYISTTMLPRDATKHESANKSTESDSKVALNVQTVDSSSENLIFLLEN